MVWTEEDHLVRVVAGELLETELAILRLIEDTRLQYPAGLLDLVTAAGLHVNQVVEQLLVSSEYRNVKLTRLV